MIGSGSLQDVAFAVCTAMQDAGETVVLSGGGAAAFYAPDAYVTRDLDFILRFSFSAPPSEPILNLGFRQTSSRGIYAHPDTIYTVEFIPGPLAIGDDIVTEWQTIECGAQLLNIITPTDSVRDRLAAGIHWHDLNAARQAAHVARAQSVNLDAVRSWCTAEGGERVWVAFQEQLRALSSILTQPLTPPDELA